MASLSTAARNAATTAVCGLANGGSLRIYDGTPPASAEAALSGNTLLATLPMSATAFGTAGQSVAGQAAANAITAATAAASSVGGAKFFRVLKADNTTVVFQGTVGTSGAELNLSSVDIVAGGNVSVSSLTYTQAAS